jgi:hypothetical protein
MCTGKIIDPVLRQDTCATGFLQPIITTGSRCDQALFISSGPPMSHHSVTYVALSPTLVSIGLTRHSRHVIKSMSLKN